MIVQMKPIGSLTMVGLAIGAAMMFASANVNADPIVNFTVDVTGGTPFATANWSQTANPQVTPGLYSVTHFQAGSPHPSGLQGPGGEWSILWNITADDDAGGAAFGAQITSGFTVTNHLAELPDTSLNHLQFSILVDMDLSAVVGTQFFGSGGFTLLAPGGSGAFNQITALNGPIYNYLLNGVDVASLFPMGYNLGQSGPGTNAASQGLGAGQTGPLAGMVVTSLGIRLDFDLTPGETLTFNGTWAFIPAPGCLALMAIAGMTGRSRRRRD